MSNEIDALYDALSELHEAPKEQRRFTAEEERVWAGFEEISCFYEERGHAPRFGEEHDIFERIYATRLRILRESKHWREFLAAYDRHNLLTAEAIPSTQTENLSDEALLAELGAEFGAESSLTKLVHVKPRTEADINKADEIAERSLCTDFTRFKPLFTQIQADLQNGIRKTKSFEKTSIQQGEFFILGGQLVYVAEMGEKTAFRGSEMQARLRVIYDNGTESNILLRSLQRALYKDKAGRRISEPLAGPLFGSAAEEDDIQGGIIYVLESLSEQPDIAAQKGLLHKIGVTGGDVRKRLANAVKDPTFLLAEVRIVREYQLFNIKRVALEQIIHKVFTPAKADIKLRDRFGEFIQPREWFLVPLPAIDEAVQRIKNGTITNFHYNATEARFVENE